MLQQDAVKLYNELAAWWQLMSPASDYAEEAEFYSKKRSDLELASNEVFVCVRPVASSR